MGPPDPWGFDVGDVCFGVAGAGLAYLCERQYLICKRLHIAAAGKMVGEQMALFSRRSVPPEKVFQVLTTLSKAKRPVNISGRLLVNGTTLFDEGLGIDRADMPQVPGNFKPEFYDQLREGGVTLTPGTATAAKLRPTQKQMDGAAIGKMLATITKESLEKNPILISSDGFVVDGHHRWAAYVALGMAGKQPVEMPVVMVGVPIGEILPLAHEFMRSKGIQARAHGDHTGYSMPLSTRKGIESPEQIKARYLTPEDQRTFELYAGKGGFLEGLVAHYEPDWKPVHDRYRVAEQQFSARIDKVAGGYTAFDAAVSTPELMGQVGRLGKVLGPRNLMPNPKTGTVTPDPAKAVTEIKGGKIEFRVDKHSNVHFIVGKASFSEAQLADNFRAAMDEVQRLKPSSSKGRYIQKATLSTTFGPGIPLDLASL
jgi:hypothetical protein